MSLTCASQRASAVSKGSAPEPVHPGLLVAQAVTSQAEADNKLTAGRLTRITFRGLAKLGHRLLYVDGTCQQNV